MKIENFIHIKGYTLTLVLKNKASDPNWQMGSWQIPTFKNRTCTLIDRRYYSMSVFLWQWYEKLVKQRLSIYLFFSKKIYDQLFIRPQKIFKPYSQLTAKILDRTKNMALWFTMAKNYEIVEMFHICKTANVS